MSNKGNRILGFESSVNSYDSQTAERLILSEPSFESSVNSYDSQTVFALNAKRCTFESSVNSYDIKLHQRNKTAVQGLRVV